MKSIRYCTVKDHETKQRQGYVLIKIANIIQDGSALSV